MQAAAEKLAAVEKAVAERLAADKKLALAEKALKAAKKAAAEKLEDIKNKKAGKLFAEARAIDERIKKTDVPSYEDLKRFHNLSKDIEDL